MPFAMLVPLVFLILPTTIAFAIFPGILVLQVGFKLLALLAGGQMATITVRNLDDEVQQRIKQQAAANNRSMEAEARAILSAGVRGHGLAAWIASTEGLRGDDIPIPPRSPARELDLS